MRKLLLALLLVGGCQIDLDSGAGTGSAAVCQMQPNNVACAGADVHSDFTFVYGQILQPQCGLSTSCHQNRQSTGGYLDFSSQGSAYQSLVNRASNAVSGRTLVVPGDPQASFMLVMLGDFLPQDADPPLDAIPQTDFDGNAAGAMPQGEPFLCCERLQAISQWIAAGAPME